MKRRLLPLLLSLSLLFSLLPAALAQEEASVSVTALCVAEADQPVFLDAKELGLLCQQATGHELVSVSWAHLSNRVGSLTCEGEAVTPDTPYYLYQHPQLSQICFTPYSRFTGQRELTFTMTSKREETVSGVLLFYVPKAAEDLPPDSPMNDTAVVRQGEPVPLMDFLPERVWCRTSKGYRGDKTSWTVGDSTYIAEELESASFSRLPSSAQGYLWLDYQTPDARKVLPGEVLYSGKDPNLYDVTFVPAGKETKAVRLDYTASCSTDAEVPGSLTLNPDRNKTPAQPTDTVSPDDVQPNLPGDRFQDMTGWEWAVPAADFLDEQKAVFSNAGQPIFRPGDPATRMELIYALVHVAYPSVEEAPAPAFSDLPDNRDLSGAAAMAAAHGLVLGDGENRLLPNAQITRQDALVIIYRSLSDLTRPYQPLPQSADLDFFSDAKDLASYAREAAAVLFSKGILQGDDSRRLAPLSPITRAEMASLLYRAFGE